MQFGFSFTLCKGGQFYRYAVYCSVARQFIEIRRISNVIAGNSRMFDGSLHPNPLAIVAIAVREADNSGHHRSCGKQGYCDLAAARAQ